MEEIILKNKDIYPVDELIKKARGEKISDIIIKTILSQNTSDKLRDIAFLNLKSKFRSVKEILEAKPREIEKLIRICGLPKVKTKRLKTALRKILEKYPDPEEMRHENGEKLFDFLSSIYGIGPKSASVILAFAGFEAFPVDTHVARIIRRLGIADGTREKIFKTVSPHIKNKVIAHVFLINHGRNVCKSKNPKCEECVFLQICDFGKKYFGK